MDDYRRHAASAENRPFPYISATLAILMLGLSAAELVAWHATGRGEYWMISKKGFALAAEIIHAHPWATLFIACMALICGLAAWLFRRARPGNHLAEALEKDPEAQARWISSTPR